ncbi:MAG: glycosyltransferase family 2 protein [Terriglobales bacterium]
MVPGMLSLSNTSTMTQPELLVTILINNYNYSRFLRQAIDSALDQTYTNIEVLVVDDGSTDESRNVIYSYGDRVRAVFKENGGQASTFNAGVAASRGEIICMLDADDFFHSDKVERVIRYIQPGSMLYHQLRLQPGVGLIPSAIAPNIDYYLRARRSGFVPYLASPTSGLVFCRDLALRLIPLPTEHVRYSADDFIVRGAALLGKIIGIPEVLATYRVHGENGWYGRKIQKSPKFMAELEGYLNRKLVQAGKKPVIDFYHSPAAIDYIPQHFADIVRLALSVFSRRVNLITVKFMLYAFLRAFACVMSPSVSGTPDRSN